MYFEKSGAKSVKSSLMQDFGEHVGELLVEGNALNLNSLAGNKVADKVHIHLDIFSALLEEEI